MSATNFMSARNGLRLYNTLTRTKEDFSPIDPHNVRMYVCGPTVYDFAHIGNARPVIVFDVLFRLLRHLYGDDHVTYVRNITDVDDKINARARPRLSRRCRSTRRSAGSPKRPTRSIQRDVKALGCLEPTFQPRATEYIAEMQRHDRAADRTGAAMSPRSRAVLAGEVLFDSRARCPTTARSPPQSSTRCWPAPASPSTRTRRTRSTSCCGSCPPSRTSRAGQSPWGTRSAGRAGTSNARR